MLSSILIEETKIDRFTPSLYYIFFYWIEYNIFVVMRRMVWQFLNTKFDGILVYKRVWYRMDSRIEEFVTQKGMGIMKYTYYFSGKEVRTRVNSFVKNDIKSYFDLDDIDIEIYVLDWCRDKSIEDVEME